MISACLVLFGIDLVEASADLLVNFQEQCDIELKAFRYQFLLHAFQYNSISLELIWAKQ